MKLISIEQIYEHFKRTPSVIIDSRSATSNTIFFALKGDNFDGHNFVETALQNGCNFVVIDNEKYYKGEQYLLVKNCLQALQDLAKFHRQQLKIPFIAITGSNGKTTTKELLKCVLSKKYQVLATSGNLNNHIGVPLTILSITPNINMAVIEMGANHVGEITLLCEIAQPDFGLITNIGKAHIGEFGGFENIVKSKTELYRFLSLKKGKIFLNIENELLVQNALNVETITYGEVHAAFSNCVEESTNPYIIINHEGETIASKLIGKYNMENICAAICIGKYFGVHLKSLKEAIEAYEPSNNRSQIIQRATNKLILDAYNANPSSMKAAIENFIDMTSKNKWLILGDMLELGVYEFAEHKNILELISKKDFQNVILVGDKFLKAAEATNFSAARLCLYSNTEQLVEKLKSNPSMIQSSLVLLKGSRGMKLEKVVEYL